MEDATVKEGLLDFLGGGGEASGSSGPDPRKLAKSALGALKQVKRDVTGKVTKTLSDLINALDRFQWSYPAADADNFFKKAARIARNIGDLGHSDWRTAKQKMAQINNLLEEYREANRPRVVEADDDRCIVYVDRLWEVDERQFERRLRRRGLPVDRVRKVVWEGRGHLAVDLYQAESQDVVRHLVEDEGTDDNNPDVGSVYSSSVPFEVQPQTAAYVSGLIKVEPEVKFRIQGEYAFGKWSIVILDGDHTGAVALLDPETWEEIRSEVNDHGTPDDDQGDGDSDEEGDEGESDEPELKNFSKNKRKLDGEPDEGGDPHQNPDTGNPFVDHGSYGRVNRDFPEFSRDTTFADFLSFDPEEFIDNLRDRKLAFKQKKKDMGFDRF